MELVIRYTWYLESLLSEGRMKKNRLVIPRSGNRIAVAFMAFLKRDKKRQWSTIQTTGWQRVSTEHQHSFAEKQWEQCNRWKRFDLTVIISIEWHKNYTFMDDPNDESSLRTTHEASRLCWTFTSQESMNVSIMQLNNLKFLTHFLESSFALFSFFAPKNTEVIELYMTTFKWPWWGSIMVSSDEQVSLWKMAF